MTSKSNISELLVKIKEEGINIFIEEGNLKIKTPKGYKIDQGLLENLKTNKESIINVLKDQNSSIDNNEVPLSFSQEILWINDQLNGSQAYHVVTLLKLEGELNKEMVSFSFNQIVNRHKVLRTVYKNKSNTVFQEPLKEDTWQLIYTDISTEKNNDVHAYIQKIIGEPFDLSCDHVFRVNLLKIDDENYYLVIVIHHIAFDGASMPILIEEFITLYRSKLKGVDPFLNKLPIQYTDYAIQQNKKFQNGFYLEKLEYWKNKLTGLENLVLPVDHARSNNLIKSGGFVDFVIDKRLSDDINDVAKACKVSLYTILVAAFKVLLFRYSGQKDICIGTPMANRLNADTQYLIGFFANTLPLRDVLSEDATFLEVLDQVKVTILDAYNNQDVPYIKIMEELALGKESTNNQLFNVLFVLQNSSKKEIVLDNLKIVPEQPEHNTSTFDLTFSLTEWEDGISLLVEFSSDLYERSTIERMCHHFNQLLKSINANPDEQISKLKIIDAKEESLILHDFNNLNNKSLSNKSVLDLFHEQVLLFPDAIAVMTGNKSISYKDIDERSNQLGNFLIKNNLEKDSLVALCLNRSAEMIIGMFGIMKAGCAYVPIDAKEYPAHRINYILDDIDAKFIITNEFSHPLVPVRDNAKTFIISESNEELNKQSIAKPAANVSYDNLMYVIYTSGSTGEPKGVLVEHKGIVNLVLEHRNILKISNGIHFLQFASISFDASCFEIYNTILNGAKLVVLDKEKLIDSNSFGQIIEEYKISALAIHPSYQEIVQDKLKGVKILISGGEPLNPIVAKNIIDKKIKLFNSYGPTENTVCITIADNALLPNGKVTIGKPVNNVEVYILDDQRNPVPIGIEGELYVSGRQLSRGYLNQPELTKDKFLINKFNPESTLYKTGDIAKWLPTGNIELLGRIDDQIKIRGYRVELSEIEAIIKKSGYVQQCVVVVHEPNQGDKHLVSYVVTNELEIKQKLISHLRSKFPNYMIPSFIIELDEIPMTANDKVDKKRLPQPNFEELKNEYVAPRNKTDQKLISIWEKLLKIDKIGINDDFFSLGGNSIKAIKVISEIREELRTEITIKEFFEKHTIALLADYILTNDGAIDSLLLQKVDVEHVPLSFSQERLWFMDKLEGSTNYHIPFVLKIEGLLDLNILERSIKKVLDRQHVLRTVFKETTENVNQIKIPSENFGIDVEIYTHKAKEEELEQSISNYINKPFNLEKDYMVRAGLKSYENNEQYLTFVFHHIAFDGWSISIFSNELSRFYNAELLNTPLELENLPVQYSHYSYWQRQDIVGKYLSGKLEYWTEKLKDVERLQLPTDYKLNKRQELEGNQFHLNLDNVSLKKLNSFCEAEGVTLFTLLITTFKLLLYRYSNQTDICIGIPVTNRTHKELVNLVGFFINMLPIRSDLKNNPKFSELLSVVKENLLEGYSNKEVPFEKIVEKVLKNRDQNYSPIFQAMFLFNESAENDSSSFTLGNTNIENHSFSSNSVKYELTFNIDVTAMGLILKIEYANNLFNVDTITRFSKNYECLLNNVLANKDAFIDEIQTVTKEEESLLLNNFDYKSLDKNEEKTILDLFSYQVVSNPDKIVVTHNAENITFIELDKKSNQLAHYLIKKGITNEILVPICLESSIDLIVSILGILKAGGAYVPIDSKYPVHRISYILDDISAKILITNEANSLLLKDRNDIMFVKIDTDKEKILAEETGSLNVNINTSDLMYVLYTSGSTGNPKGAMIEHGSLINRLDWQWNTLNFSKNDSILQKTTYCFDVSVWEIFMPLGWGCRMVLCDRNIVVYPELLSNLIYSEQISVLHFVPSALEAFSLSIFKDEEKIKNIASLRMVIASGESLSVPLIKKWHSFVNIPLFNLYGPTEATIDVTYHETRPDDNLDIIGKPVQNTKLYVLNKAMQLVPIGGVGELHIGGIQLSRGYFNQPELTNQKFITNEFNNSTSSKLYKSGDLVKYLPSGSIEFIDRIDNQVKIRGHRIELGEIEKVLLQIKNIQQVVVIVKEINDEKYLAAYIVANEKINIETIKDMLYQYLPEYMVPSHYAFVDYIPLTTSLKIDKKALLGTELNSSEKKFIAPQTEIEKTTAKIWSELLGIESISTDANFFEIGGHSLLAIKIINRINTELKLNLPISMVFEFPSIGRFSKKIIENNYNSRLIPLNNCEAITTYYCVSDLSGDPLLFTEFARLVDSHISLYGFVSPGLDQGSQPLASIEEIAAEYVEQIIVKDGGGKYNLLGYSFGGKIIYEMTLQLEKRGYEVSSIVLIDSLNPHSDEIFKANKKNDFIDYLLDFKHFYNSNLLDEENEEMTEFSRTDFTENDSDKIFNQFYEKFFSVNNYHFTKEQLKRYIDVFIANDTIFYNPEKKQVIKCPITLFRAWGSNNSDNEKLAELLVQEDYGWADYTNKQVQLYKIPADHSSIINKQNIKIIASELKKNAMYSRE